MSEHMFCVYRGNLTDEEFDEADDTAKRHGAWVNGGDDIPGTGPQWWFCCHNYGAPHDQNTALAVLADLRERHPDNPMVRTPAKRQGLENHDCRSVYGNDSWWEYDARGIELCRVCDTCRDVKLARYRPEILTDSNYEADEPIEPDY